MDKKDGIFLILVLSVVFTSSLVFSGGSGGNFNLYCVPREDCYVGQCGTQPSDILFLDGNASLCIENTYCDSNNTVTYYIESDFMNQTTKDICDAGTGECCGDFVANCTYPTEDCSATGDTCYNPLGNNAHCCTPTVTCTDYARNLTDQCGLGLSEGCGLAGLDCLSMPPQAVCNTTANLYYCNSTTQFNCDFDWTNGCEIDSANDPNNCGGCGIMCNTGFACFSGVCEGDIPNFWTDMVGNPISMASLGDFVRFDSFYDDATTTYQITDDPKEIESAWLETYYETTFVTTTGLQFRVNGVNNNLSGPLTVDASPGIDDPLKVSIVTPSCGSDFNKGDIMQVAIELGDADDLAYGTLKIKDLVVPFDNLNSHLFYYNYTLLSAGNLQLVVDANNSAGEAFRTTTNVMVYDSTDTSEQKYVAACIDEPANFDSFTTSDVHFKAHSSRGIIFTGDGGTSGTFVNVTPDELYFLWTFLYSNGQEAVCEGVGSEPCPGDTTPFATKYNFIKKFPTVNDNYAFLTVSF